MEPDSYAAILERIQAALEASRAIFARFTPGAIETEYKIGHDPVTEADRALDAVLRKELLREGEGWLSEESVDDPIRLQRSCVWVVDPLDGTREFVKGIPEFCVSIGYVRTGVPLPEESSIPQPTKLFWEQSTPALRTTDGRLGPASVRALTGHWFSPAAAK